MNFFRRFFKSQEVGYIQTQLNDIQTTLETIVSSVTRPRNETIDLTSATTASTYQDIFETFIQKQARQATAKYAPISKSLTDLIVAYDKSLYYPKKAITFDQMFARMAELGNLKRMIQKLLFGAMDVKSQYLYYVPSKHFYNTVNAIPAIDVDTMFDVNTLTNDNDAFTGNYVVVDFKPNTIQLTCTTGNFEIDNHLRKTVMRVLYSIYTDKYYLYHLFKESGTYDHMAKDGYADFDNEAEGK